MASCTSWTAAEAMVKDMESANTVLTTELRELSARVGAMTNDHDELMASRETVSKLTAHIFSLKQQIDVSTQQHADELKLRKAMEDANVRKLENELHSHIEREIGLHERLTALVQPAETLPAEASRYSSSVSGISHTGQIDPQAELDQELLRERLQ